MTKYSCPSCGAELQFASPMSVFQVCPYCRSTIVRTDVDVQALGKMAVLQDDFSPIQIGTTGKQSNKSNSQFIVIGRVRVAWDDGFWNEWYLRFDDGREGWLGEAQGFYMISFQLKDVKGIGTGNKIALKQQFNIDDAFYVVDDVKNVTYTFAEGELPFKAPQGHKAVSVDLRAGSNKFASFTFDEDGTADAFTGQYFEFSELHFQNLRQLDGW